MALPASTISDPSEPNCPNEPPLQGLTSCLFPTHTTGHLKSALASPASPSPPHPPSHPTALQHWAAGLLPFWDACPSVSAFLGPLLLLPPAFLLTLLCLLQGCLPSLSAINVGVLGLCCSPCPSPSSALSGGLLLSQDPGCPDCPGLRLEASPCISLLSFAPRDPVASGHYSYLDVLQAPQNNLT